MHGGLKVYRGSPAAARSYVEADRGRVDDYYLAEGTGVAQRYLAAPEAGVRDGGTLTGDAYEAWVGGYDPATGAPKGRVRTDAAAVRFVEVVVNGPKTWSLAAALDPGIAEAYDAAQGRASQQIMGGWPSTRRRGWGRGADRFRCPSSVSKQPPSGTTPPEPATHTVICTCRSTRAYGPRASGEAYILSASAT
jgi:TrwC relaxase